jgi:hypothetical protein
MVAREPYDEFHFAHRPAFQPGRAQFIETPQRESPPLFPS